MIPEHSRSGKPNRVAILLDPDAVEQVIDDRIPSGFLRRRIARETQERGACTRHLPIEDGQNVMADPIPRKPPVDVGRIVERDNAASSGVGEDGGAVPGEKRADDPASLRGNAGQTPQAGAAQQSEEDRFDLVVGVMGRCDPVGRRPVRGLFEKRVARPPRGLLAA